MKRHMRSGQIMFSDHHSSYVTMRSSRSNLTRYGWFHFWINHSAYYVHEKFTFVQTASIENTWLKMRHQMMSLKMQVNDDRIDEYLNTFMLMQLIKQPRRESWTLHCLRKYYIDQYREYHQKTLCEELMVPNVMGIQQIN